MARGRKGKESIERALTSYLTQLIVRNSEGKSVAKIEKTLAIGDGEKFEDSYLKRYLMGKRKMSANALQKFAKSAETKGLLVDVVTVELDGEIYEIEVPPEGNGWQSFNFNQMLGDPNFPEKDLSTTLNEVKDEIEQFNAAHSKLQKAVDQLQKCCVALKFGTCGKMEEDDSPFEGKIFVAGNIQAYFDALRTQVAECQIGFPPGTTFSGFDRLV